MFRSRNNIREYSGDCSDERGHRRGNSIFTIVIYQYSSRTKEFDLTEEMEMIYTGADLLSLIIIAINVAIGITAGCLAAQAVLDDNTEGALALSALAIIAIFIALIWTQV